MSNQAPSGVHDPNYRGRLREARPPNALIGPRIDSDDNGSTCKGKGARAEAGGWPVVLIIKFPLSCPLTRKEPRLTRGKDAKPALTRTVCAEPSCRLPAPIDEDAKGGNHSHFSVVLSPLDVMTMLVRLVSRARAGEYGYRNRVLCFRVVWGV